MSLEFKKLLFQKHKQIVDKISDNDPTITTLDLQSKKLFDYGGIALATAFFDLSWSA